MYTLCDDSVGTRDNNVSGHSTESGLGTSMSGLATWRRYILIEMQMDVCPLSYKYLLPTCSLRGDTSCSQRNVVPACVGLALVK